MTWHVLLVLLIPVVVAILANLLRGAEQKDRPSPSGESRPPARRPTTDLDRFLEEARRRRDPPQRRDVSVGSEVPPASPPEPAAPRQQRRPVRPRESRVPPRRPPVLLEEATAKGPPAPVAVPVAVPTAEPVRRAVEVTPVPVPAPAPDPVAPAATREKVPSPVLRQVAQILRTPRSAAAAIVLREIFDPPLCKRPRHV